MAESFFFLRQHIDPQPHPQPQLRGEVHGDREGGEGGGEMKTPARKRSRTGEADDTRQDKDKDKGKDRWAHINIDRTANNWAHGAERNSRREKIVSFPEKRLGISLGKVASTSYDALSSCGKDG